ncbi:MAG: hypothetical protein AAB503_00330 [Patescibacteria group bacterium]
MEETKTINKTITVVFVEFTTELGKKELFVGSDVESVLSSTKNGSEFADVKYTEYREVTSEDVSAIENLNASILKHGIECVKKGLMKTYFLGVA